MAHIDYFFSTISPFAYLARNRLEEIAGKHGATITYKPVDLIALFGRTGGLAPKDRHPSRQEMRLQELRRQAIKADMTINLHPAFWPTNPAPSSYAIIAAQQAGDGDVGKLVAAITSANLEEAASRGVFGAPFYITDSDERFWGQDRLDDLDLHLSGKL